MFIVGRDADVGRARGAFEILQPPRVGFLDRHRGSGIYAGWNAQPA
jgi:hypothetical protein